MKDAEHEMGEMLTSPSTDPVKHTVVSGFLDGIAFHGEDWINDWKTRLRNFSPELAEMMVRQHLHFQPRWALEQMGVARGEVLFVYEQLLAIVQNLIWVLCGLNQLYHPGKLKGIAWTMRKMAVAPPHFRERCEQLFRAEPQVATQEVSNLIEEMLTLVETHMPQVQTTRAREIFAMHLRK